MKSMMEADETSARLGKEASTSPPYTIRRNLSAVPVAYSHEPTIL